MALDGSGRTTLANTGLFLSGIDVTATHIYLTHLFGGVFRMNLDGSGLQELYSRADGTQIRGIVASEIAPVPEPESWALLAAGLGLIAWKRSRRRS